MFIYKPIYRFRQTPSAGLQEAAHGRSELERILAGSGLQEDEPVSGPIGPCFEGTGVDRMPVVFGAMYRMSVGFSAFEIGVYSEYLIVSYLNI